MNRQQPVPTMLQRLALSAYNAAHRDAIHHAERRMHRAVAPIMPPIEPKQPEPVNCCATPEADDAAMFTRAEAVIFALLVGASVGVYFANTMGWIS